MILPIVAYGASILRKECIAISADYPQLNNLIADMWDTLDSADGVGLAAPQVNVAIKLFLVDSAKTYQPYIDAPTKQQERAIRKVFINPTIITYSKEKDIADEGCLSIPGIYVPTERSISIRIRYVDERFHERIETYQGRTARMIQHEYDHIIGKLHIDYLPNLQKIRLSSKLNKIRKGKIKAEYPMYY
ncbi:MAG TPA: peptide deformylase [Pseudosphingobacterium sp.]|nr:peptide deformylase [Pseudosphingobacterium sp.]